jgi:hypothetical protein
MKNKLIQIFCILLLFTVKSTYSQTFHTDIQAVQEKDIFRITLSLKGYDHNLVVNTLRQGLRSEITYYLRVFKKSNGFESFFGDRLLNEYQYTISGEKDIFQNGFSINSAEQKKIYSTAHEFEIAYFTYDKFKIPNDLFSPGEEHYLQGRIRIKKIKLVPPFNLINLFWTDNNKVTSWTKLKIKVPDLE